MREIPIDKIQPNPLQPREKFEKKTIKELADSIKEAGLLEPIVVKPDGNNFEIIAGERRWRAFKMLGKEKIPAIEWEVEDDRDALEKSFIENWHRENLADTEKEKVINELWESGRYESQSEMAKKTGANKKSIREYLDTSEFRKHTGKEEAKSASHTRIRATKGLEDKEREEVVTETKNKGIPARKVEEEIVPAVKKVSTEETKKAVIRGDIEPEEVEVISNLEPENQKRILRRKKISPHLSLREIKTEIEAEEEREPQVQQEVLVGSFRCPECEKEFNVIHQEPEGSHKIEEVEE